MPDIESYEVFVQKKLAEDYDASEEERIKKRIIVKQEELNDLIEKLNALKEKATPMG